MNKTTHTDSTDKIVQIGHLENREFLNALRASGYLAELERVNQYELVMKPNAERMKNLNRVLVILEKYIYYDGETLAIKHDNKMPHTVISFTFDYVGGDLDDKSDWHKVIDLADHWSVSATYDGRVRLDLQFDFTQNIIEVIEKATGVRYAVPKRLQQPPSCKK